MYVYKYIFYSIKIALVLDVCLYLMAFTVSYVISSSKRVMCESTWSFHFRLLQAMLDYINILTLISRLPIKVFLKLRKRVFCGTRKVFSLKRCTIFFTLGDKYLLCCMICNDVIIPCFVQSSSITLTAKLFAPHFIPLSCHMRILNTVSLQSTFTHTWYHALVQIPNWRENTGVLQIALDDQN